jgi:hypothetical protein
MSDDKQIAVRCYFMPFCHMSEIFVAYQLVRREERFDSSEFAKCTPFFDWVVKTPSFKGLNGMDRKFLIGV